MSTEDPPTVHELQLLAKLEILLDLFTLLQSIEAGEVKAQDFDKSAGPIRLKLANIRRQLAAIDGVCESVAAREQKIEQLQAGNERRVALLNEFKAKVLAGSG